MGHKCIKLICLVVLFILASSCEDYLVYNITIKNSSEDVIYVDYSWTDKASSIIIKRASMEYLIEIPKDSVFHEEFILTDYYKRDKKRLIHRFLVLKPSTYNKYSEEFSIDPKLCDGDYMFTTNEFTAMDFTFVYTGE